MNHFHRFYGFPSVAILFISQCFGALFSLNTFVLMLRLGLGTWWSLHCIILLYLILAQGRFLTMVCHCILLFWLLKELTLHLSWWSVEISVCTWLAEVLILWWSCTYKSAWGCVLSGHESRIRLEETVSIRWTARWRNFNIFSVWSSFTIVRWRRAEEFLGWSWLCELTIGGQMLNLPLSWLWSGWLLSKSIWVLRLTVHWLSGWYLFFFLNVLILMKWASGLL